MSWTIETSSDRSALRELAEWWDRCPGPAGSPFLTSDWFTLWTDAFLPDGASFELTLWKRDGQVAAALPLMATGWRGASLSNSHTDVFDVIAEDSLDTSVVRDWMARRTMTRLYRLDGESGLVPSAPDDGWQVAQTSASPYAALDSGLDGLRENMGRNLKKNINRLERRLAEVGELTYLDNADDELPDAVDLGLALEASGWKGETGTAMVSTPASERFYRSLFELARDRGWLRVSAILLAERLVACQFSLDYAGRRFLLKPAYDEDLASHSPGRVLQWKVMQAAVQSGLTSYEFGGEAERWKMEWTSTTRPRLNVLRFASLGPRRLIAAPLKFVAARRDSHNHAEEGPEEAS